MSNKKSSLPPSLFPFVLHPSIPVLSWTTLLWSSAAMFGKINRATGKGPEQKATSGGAEGRSVDVSAAVTWPFALVMDRGMQSTHMHTLFPPLIERIGVSVCGFDPGNDRNVEGQCQSSGRSACPSSHTDTRKLHTAEALYTLFHICKCHTSISTYHAHKLHA